MSVEKEDKTWMAEASKIMAELRQERDQYRSKLDAAEKVISFYQDKNNWLGPQYKDGYRYFSRIIETDCEVMVSGNLIGGKLAREYLAGVWKK